MSEKCCNHCKEIKPVSEFGKDRRNKDGLNGYCKACKKLYNDAQKGYRAAYRLSHLEKYGCRGRQLSAEDGKIKRARYKAVVYGNVGTFTKSDIENCLDFFGHECAYSGVPLTKGYSLDHVAPLSKGGENEIHNIVPCLDIVNIRKAAQDWELWYVEQPYYSEGRHAKIKQWLNMREGA